MAPSLGAGGIISSFILIYKLWLLLSKGNTLRSEMVLMKQCLHMDFQK